MSDEDWNPFLVTLLNMCQKNQHQNSKDEPSALAWIYTAFATCFIYSFRTIWQCARLSYHIRLTHNLHVWKLDNMMRTNLIIAHGVMRMNTVIITFNSLLSYNGSGSRMAYVSKCSCLNVGSKHANKTKKTFAFHE